MTPSLDLDTLDFEKGGGLVSVVTQDARTGAVLTVAFADRAALELTIATGEMHYRSRRRGLWHKGLTSGNTQRVESLAADCDGDAVLARVHAAGPACHTGDVSCFGDSALDADVLATLDAVIAARATNDRADNASYTRRLLADRNLRLKKLGEECAELIVALGDADAERAASEAADLTYHVLVALRALGVGLDEVRDVLHQRTGVRPRPERSNAAAAASPTDRA
ncbi:MAG: bifunctional phosphoribosyl-AMP cyclohydrolase/phosphoribosyl-ATP diphosphatase HisIE [Gemmatimonadaceae bacterium]